MIIFKLAYWSGIILQIVIRTPFAMAVRSKAKTVRRVSFTENILLTLMTIFGIVIPLIYSVTGWLDFANYYLPVWLGWFGVLILAGSLFVFWRAHSDLKTNWSPSLEIRADHTLVIDGIYRYIRHPMYASQLLFYIAELLLLQNWLAGPVGLLFFIPFYLLRVRAEEKMMVDTFGSQFSEYKDKVGGILPKMPKSQA